ncbi:MAG TPA: hypothetical protein VGE22_17400 [Solimonas sp.]
MARYLFVENPSLLGRSILRALLDRMDLSNVQDCARVALDGAVHHLRLLI